MRFSPVALLFLVGCAVPEPVEVVQTEQWMSEGDPEHLGMDVNVDWDCPIKRDEVQAIVETEFRKGNIQPESWQWRGGADSRNVEGFQGMGMAAVMYLDVSVSCIPISTLEAGEIGWSADIDIQFARAIKGRRMAYMSPNYGVLLVGGKESTFIADAVAKQAHEAIKDYRDATRSEGVSTGSGSTFVPHRTK